MPSLFFDNGFGEVEISMNVLNEIAQQLDYDRKHHRKLYKALLKLDLPSINYHLNLLNDNKEISEEASDNFWEKIHKRERWSIIHIAMENLTRKQIDDIIDENDSETDRIIARDFDFNDISSKRISDDDVKVLTEYLKNHYDREVRENLAYNEQTPKDLFTVDECLELGILPYRFIKKLTYREFDKIKKLDNFHINKALSIYGDEIEDKKLSKDILIYLVTHKDPKYRKEIAIRTYLGVEEMEKIIPDDNWGTIDLAKDVVDKIKRNGYY